MDEKLQYAEMLEIPLTTSSVTYKRAKKRFFKRKENSSEDAKKKLIDKINGETESETAVSLSTAELSETESFNSPEVEETSNAAIYETDDYVHPVKKKKFKISVIGLELAVGCVLLMGIILTNVFLPNSAINTLVSNITNPQKAEQVDTRKYSDFNVSLPAAFVSSASIEEGVMTVSGKGSIYVPCDGTVAKVNKEEDGSFTVAVTHNSNFSTLIKGLDYAYVTAGDTVVKNIPVGYSLEDVSMCFKDGNGSTVTDYTIEDGVFKWAV